MCYWNRKCCAKLRFGRLLGSWERWTVAVFFMIWPQFGGRTRWCSSFASWARALAKLAVTNEFSSFRLARRFTTARGKRKNHCETGLSWYCSLALNHWNAVVWLFFSLRYCRILKDFKQYFLQTNWPYTELIHCDLRMPYGHIDLDSSCNDSNKPLPESILTYHQRCSVAFTFL